MSFTVVSQYSSSEVKYVLGCKLSLPAFELLWNKLPTTHKIHCHSSVQTKIDNHPHCRRFSQSLSTDQSKYESLTGRRAKLCPSDLTKPPGLLLSHDAHYIKEAQDDSTGE